jgi:hypothetical protein
MKTAFIFLLTLPLFGQLTISPSGIHLKAGQIQQFSAAPGPCYQWTATMGSVNLSGVYQAPFNVPVPQVVTIACSSPSGQGSGSVTLDASSVRTAGFSWNRGGIYGGTVVVESPQNPLYASSGQFLLDFDPNLLTLVPSTKRPGQQMLSVNTSNLPPGPPGPPGPAGTPGMSCPTATSCTGIILVSNPDGTVSPAINSAYAETRHLDVTNVDHWCLDTNGTSAYVCTTPTPAAWQSYSPGEWVILVPSVTSFGSATLNVDGVGLVNIKLADGTTDPGQQLVAGRWYLLVYNGLVWTMSQGDSGTQAVAIDLCSGSGAGWDCGGMYRVTTANLTLIAVPADTIPSGLTWTPVHF